MLVLVPASALAQEAADGDERIEEVVVVGSRRDPRSSFESSSPVDVISSEDIRSQGTSDIVDLLRNTVPSYQVNAQPISDAATIVRPANLRGLGPDHTLMLVNGKRRHRSAIITWIANGISDGAQGPDLSIFPSIAIKQVEVLRDGASAQYGSDAIAGVMNFVLEDRDEGVEVEAKYGQYTEEGEAAWTVAANVGLALGIEGFLNLSVEYGTSDETSRTVPRNDVQALLDGGNTSVSHPAQNWGSPDVRSNLKTFYNFGFNLNEDVTFYSFGNYASRETEGSFFYRNPDTRNGVFAVPNTTMRLIGDLTPDGMSGNCDTKYPDMDISNTTLLDELRADPDCFAFNEVFPGGFTPRFGGEAIDYSVFVGIRGTHGILTWDFSANVGSNEVDFFIFNTVNASIGPDTPTSFDPGAYGQFETDVNLDLSVPLQVDAFASDLNLAFGLEWREEQFDITRGDPDSFRQGSLAAQGFTPSANGFPGFGEIAAGNWSRANVAAYVDLEADILENWTLGVAVRWEDFDDFGTTLNGKIATHVTLTEGMAFRATYSTGFRAPTPGQSNAFNVSTVFNTAIGDLVNEGTIPSTNPVAAVKGGLPLEPEESINYTIGLVHEWTDFSLSIDYFNISVTDRLALTQTFELTDAERMELIASGVENVGTIQEFRFFTNDYETLTQGVDIVATWGLDWNNAGRTNFNFVFNKTDTKVKEFTPAIIDADRIRELEEALPDIRLNVSARHVQGPWEFALRYNYYHSWYDSEDVQRYNGYGIFDLEARYTFDFGVTAILGIDNVLNETPDENPGGPGGTGNRYSQFAPGGFNGQFIYLRATYSFDN